MSRLCLSCLIAVFFTLCASAEHQVLDSIGPELLVEVLENRGREAKIDDGGDVVWTEDGVTCRVTVYEHTLEFWDLEDEHEVSLETVNSWNQRWHFAATVYRKDEFLMFKACLPIKGGVTSQNLAEYLDRAVVLRKQWRIFLELPDR